MKYLSLFSGVGGFDHGVMLAGHECVGYIEWDKFAHESFQILHDPEGRLWNAYDIRSVTDESIRGLGVGKIPMLVGGFPCQSFSIAGKREGFTDATRGTLFFEIIRFASILRPQYLFLENVTGLLNHDKGQTFETVIGSLDELGYVGEWQVHNSSAYVPQNRERIFIVASLGGQRTRKVFPFGRENSNAIEVVGRLEGKGDDYVRRIYGVGGLSPALPTMQGGGQEPKILDDQGRTTKKNTLSDTCPTLRAQSHGNEPKVLVTKQYDQLHIRDVVTCIDANYAKGLDNHQARTGVLEPIAVNDPERVNKNQNGRRFKEPGEPMFTLTAQDKHGVAILRQTRTEYGKQVRKEYEAGNMDEGRQSMVELEPRRDGIANALTTVQKDNLLYTGYRIRKLTPLECFRLQSYPDWWYVTLKLFRHPELIELVDMTRNDITAQVQAIIQDHGIKEGMSDSQLYKMCGNGVTSAVAYDIASRLEGG